MGAWSFWMDNYIAMLKYTPIFLLLALITCIPDEELIERKPSRQQQCDTVRDTVYVYDTVFIQKGPPTGGGPQPPTCILDTLWIVEDDGGDTLQLICGYDGMCYGFDQNDPCNNYGLLRPPNPDCPTGSSLPTDPDGEGDHPDCDTCWTPPPTQGPGEPPGNPPINDPDDPNDDD